MYLTCRYINQDFHLIRKEKNAVEIHTITMSAARTSNFALPEKKNCFKITYNFIFIASLPIKRIHYDYKQT